MQRKSLVLGNVCSLVGKITDIIGFSHFTAWTPINVDGKTVEKKLH